MSFLNKHTRYISAKITNKGRKALSSGNFQIKFFQIGDSEFDYSHPITNQKVMEPFENGTELKYPYLIDNADKIPYGIPTPTNEKTTIRNVMGSSGFISKYKSFDNCEDGSYVTSYYEPLNLNTLNGGNTITTQQGKEFKIGDFITIVMDSFCGTDPKFPIINYNTLNSFVYKIVNIVNNVLTLDRNLPNLNLTGFGHIIKNKFYVNNDIKCEGYDNLKQQDSWLMKVLWDENIIGHNGSTLDQNVTKFNTTNHISTKEYFGYNSTNGQIFTDSQGQPITGFSCENISVGFKSCDGAFHEITPEEQRSIAIIHFELLEDLDKDPDKPYKYDDYISTKTGLTGNDISLVSNDDDEPLSDNDYFEVYIPFLMYHRSNLNTIGALFTMDTNDYYVVSKLNKHSKIRFRFLLDEKNNRVGKVFPDNKLVIFDDQEIVAALDYRSNRKFTLPSPKISMLPNTTNNEPLINGNTKQTFFITYMLGMDKNLYSLPCNYFRKITVNESDLNYFRSPSNILISFNEDELKFMGENINNIKNRFIFNQLNILIQETDGSLPKPDQWKIIDVTNQLDFNNLSLIEKDSLISTPLVIDKNSMDSSPIFDIEQYTTTNYINDLTSVELPQFGETQPFPGSIKLVRGTDIEEMNFRIYLPLNQFNTTQNPTYINGDKYITEVHLLNERKETIVQGKLTIPIKRFGSQIFNIKIDF